MSKIKSLIIGSVAALTLFVGYVQAHDGPESNKWKVTTVRWIQQNENDLDKDDVYVVVIGKITKQLDSDSYVFTDGTGELELDSDIKLPVGEQIVVRGHVDQRFLHVGPLEIEVKSWRPANKEGLILKK